METIWQRFNNNVKKTKTCWLWTGYNSAYRYGRIYYDGRHWPAHRLSYFLHNGFISPNLYVCHSCDNILCVNPEHLFLGTQQDNMDDMRAKGRQYNTIKTHCKYGHPFSGDNLRIQTDKHHPNGMRICRQCVRDGYHRRQGIKKRVASDEGSLRSQ